jgi:hypothetical protein
MWCLRKGMKESNYLQERVGNFETAIGEAPSLIMGSRVVIGLAHLSIGCMAFPRNAEIGEWPFRSKK